MVKLSNQRPLPQQEERKFLQPAIRPSPRGAPGHSTGVKRPPAQTPGAHTHGAGRWAQNSQPSPRSTKRTKPSPTRERVTRRCTRVSPPAHGPSRLICREGGRQPPSPSPAEETEPEPALHTGERRGGDFSAAISISLGDRCSASRQAARLPPVAGARDQQERDQQEAKRGPGDVSPARRGNTTSFRETHETPRSVPSTRKLCRCRLRTRRPARSAAEPGRPSDAQSSAGRAPAGSGQQNQHTGAPRRQPPFSTGLGPRQRVAWATTQGTHSQRP